MVPISIEDAGNTAVDMVRERAVERNGSRYPEREGLRL
jgi:hypothetical protein